MRNKKITTANERIIFKYVKNHIFENLFFFGKNFVEDHLVLCVCVWGGGGRGGIFI